MYIQFVFSVGLLVFVPAALSVDPKMSAFLSQTFSNLDSNKDGTLTYDEFQDGVGHNYDTNKDGKITRSEFVSKWTSSFPGQGDAGGNVYSQVDFNHDGVWTPDDLKNLFKSFDLNKDGAVKQSEFVGVVAGAFAAAKFDPSNVPAVG